MKRTRQFTLIELLLVIGIMILIMGLTVPSFRRMASGNAVNASARMLAGQLKLARAAAIAEQRYIAIVMPGAHFLEEGTTADIDNHYHFKSFRAAIVEPTGNNNEFRLVEWYPDSSWAYLPIGAVIAEVNDSCLSLTNSAAAGYELFDNAIGRHINIGGWLTSNALNDSNGVFEYVIDSGTTRLAQGRVNNSSTKNARAIVFSPKGRCTNQRGSYADRYITIVEGMVETTAYNDGQISNPSLSQDNLNNMKILRIIGITGKVEYVNLEQVGN